MKFVAIRKNHTFGRIWKDGDVLESDVLPNHHFVSADDFGKPSVQSTRGLSGRNPTATVRLDEPMTLSALSQIPQAQGGFASSLNKPMKTRSKQS